MLCVPCTTGLNTPLSVPKQSLEKCNTDTQKQGLSREDVYRFALLSAYETFNAT
jgi:hypothetical protein